MSRDLDIAYFVVEKNTPTEANKLFNKIEKEFRVDTNERQCLFRICQSACFGLSEVNIFNRFVLITHVDIAHYEHIIIA